MIKLRKVVPINHNKKYTYYIVINNNKCVYFLFADSLSNSYRTTPTEEATPDILTSKTPQSPIYENHHHHQHHHQEQSHQQQQLHQHQHHQQQQAQNLNQFQTTATYTTHALAPYPCAAIDVNVGSFEDEGSNMPDVIPKQSSIMRTDNGDDELVDVEASMRRGWKRKQEEKNEAIGRETKPDICQRCDVCGEEANGHYFGALVCLPCKVSMGTCNWFCFFFLSFSSKYL